MKGKPHEQHKNTLEIAPGSCWGLASTWPSPPCHGPATEAAALHRRAALPAETLPAPTPLAARPPRCRLRRGHLWREARGFHSQGGTPALSPQLCIGGDASGVTGTGGCAVPTWRWALPAAQLALLLAVEAVEVSPAAAVDKGSALGDSLVVVPAQRVALAAPLIQRQAAGLGCRGKS